MSKEYIKPTLFKKEDFKQKSLYGEIDGKFDLTGIYGFHGFSCYRWSIPVRRSPENKPIKQNKFALRLNQRSIEKSL